MPFIAGQVNGFGGEFKRILRKYGYPPDKQRQATETVVKQAEWLSKEWSSV